ncbi:MAG: phospho-N-acetylmuramoyl-pentapeptide-transferase [Anaerolineae bacterium]
MNPMTYSLTLGTIAFLIAVIWGRPLISLLKQLGIGKQIRIDGPSTHLVKTGTPTMGGIMIVVPVVIITGVLNIANLLGFTLIGRSVLVPMGVLAASGLLGAIDDLTGVRAVTTGLTGRVKLAAQLGIALAAALVMSLGNLQFANTVALPGVAAPIEISPWLYIPISVFIIVGTSNAVNLTDGLDGLAGSIAAVCFTAYGVIAFLQGQVWLVAFTFTMVGGIFAFLWFNAYPAELFMGDTGSLAIGATLAVVALMTGQWLLLPIIAFMFVAVAMSVILQVGYFRLTGGKRLLKMAPLHHHFELLGWSQTQVTQRFWLVAILTAMLGIALALI